MPNSPLLTPPQQARSRRSLEKLVAAGRSILASGGPDALTVTAVTGRARVSVGSFYARFQGKDDFLRYLGEAALEDARRAWSDQGKELSGPSALRDRVERLVATLGQLFLDGPGAVLARLDGLDDPGPTRLFRLETFLASGLLAALRTTEAKALLAVRTAIVLLRDQARENQEKEVPATEAAPASDEDGAAALSISQSAHLDRETLQGELVDLLAGYLTPGWPIRAEPDPDPFDVWG